MAGERQRTNPLPGRGKDGIGDCRRQGRGSRLTDAAPFRRISIARARVDDLDARHFIHSQGAIVVEIGLLNLTLLHRDLAMQRGCQPVRHRAFHLCFHNTRVHQIAGVDGAYNAVNRKFVPGGSSAGTATAVAASMAVLGLAEETGGSIQNPASAQALVGIKPTFGLVPTAGVMPLSAWRELVRKG